MLPPLIFVLSCRCVCRCHSDLQVRTSASPDLCGSGAMSPARFCNVCGVGRSHYRRCCICCGRRVGPGCFDSDGQRCAAWMRQNPSPRTRTSPNRWLRDECICNRCESTRRAILCVDSHHAWLWRLVYDQGMAVPPELLRPFRISIGGNA